MSSGWWQYILWDAVQEFLEGDRKARFEQERELRGPVSIEPRPIITTRDVVIDEHPINVRDLLSLEFEDAVAMLNNWRPSLEGPPMWHPEESLGKRFREYLDTSPEEFSRLAMRLRDTRGVLVRALSSV